MELLGSLFIGKPLLCGAVAILFFAIYTFQRILFGNPNRAPLLTAIAWLAYAAWEGLILINSPTANIRVDLLLIYPPLTALSLWTLYRMPFNK